MPRKTLDWEYFDWREFQTLCIAIAEMIVPDCNFTEHLRQGQKQDGIDLISFSRREGKLFCIQCKREKKLTEDDLKKIISKFRSGEYFDKSSHFIIATSADLQKSDLQNFIHISQIELLNECGLFFDCWDISNIETTLKKRWDLVAKYFGKLQADEFCYPQLRYKIFQEINPLPHYIPRKLTHFSKKEKNTDFQWSFTAIKTFNLLELITSSRDKASRICIVGDAYQGKSSYIKQCIIELNHSDFHFQPVFIQIKDYNVQPVEQLLKTLCGEWQNIPLRDLILIIDGLDEVPTEQFNEMINHIKEFSAAYQPVSIVFSCRKLFYIKYNVALSLSDFDTYDLYPLQYSDVEIYLKSTLHNLFDKFKRAVSLADISGLLYHPFYLVNIVDEYLKPPHKLPNSKIKVIDSLIDRSFDFAQYRRIRGSESVNDESVRFKEVIEMFSFALQLAGVNSFSNTIIQQLFNADERLLLQHNSLITQSENNWGFANALFQEHIAASKLAKMCYADIVALCTVGNSIKKIKTKWIQTISSLISILNPDKELFKEIFTLIEEDNIELLFQTESSKYDDNLKLSLLEKLINKCIRLNIRTLIIYEDTVGHFIQESTACKNYLLELLFKKELSDRIKVVCCRILCYSLLDSKQQQRYAHFVLEELQETSDSYYAGNLIQVLSLHKIGDETFIEKIISLEKLNEFHEYRDKVYDLITVLGMVDKFYAYALIGLPYLIKHNKSIHHGGSEHNIERFLLSSINPVNISLLLKRFKEDEWAHYFERHSISASQFLQELFAKLTETYKLYPLIIFTVAELIKDLGRKYLREDFKEIDSFLEKTNTHWLVVRILIKDIFKDRNWEIGSLITHESYDYILFEFEEGNYDIHQLRSCLGGLRYKHKTEIANTFYNLCVDATEGKMVNTEGDSLHSLYVEAEKKKYVNDLIYIKSSKAFTRGIKKYFKAYGKNRIPEKDLYIDIETNRGQLRQTSDSYFVYYYLSRWHKNQVTIKLTDCIKELSNKNFFETFRAEEILNYHRRDGETDKVLLPILENYYKENLATANFKNCLWTENGMYHWLRKEFRLAEIFKKFAFETPEEYLLELVWLDNAGTRGFEHATLNKGQSISQLILDKLSEKGKLKFNQKIVENIKFGIKLESVLGTHISLCRYLGITEAKDCILDCIKTMSNEYINKPDAVDIYLELGGDATSILSILLSLNCYNDYYFNFLLSKLYRQYPKDVSVKLFEALNSLETTSENKIKFAQMLAELGSIEAFSYLVNEVRQNLKSPYNIQGGHSIANIDTLNAINELQDVMYLVIDKKYNNQSFHDSARSIILEWLNTLSAKSENDLKIVIDFLETINGKLKDEYEEATDLNWYINRMLEDFRNSDKTVKTISEINQLIHQI
ncbi:MAG TPA: hypothetical protein VK483_17215 [Chitinophagaceae bacterium]|nr:hypothetical protein [Chitinophagaceae bacterium]